MDQWVLNQRPVRSVAESRDHPLGRRTWPGTLAPIRQLLDDGLELGALTVLVGTGQLALVGQLAELTRNSRTQVLMATHSPVLAAVPDATLLQLDEQGLTPTRWDDLDLVDHYRRFLGAPMRYLRHVI